MNSSPPQVIVLLGVILVVISAIIFDRFCLQDLAQTPDAELMYFPRETWALVICISTPLGGMAYLTFGRVR